MASTFDAERRSQGLGEDQLGVQKILHGPAIIGFFAGVLLSQVRELFGRAHTLQLAISSLAITLIVMLGARFYLNWLSMSSATLSKSWVRIWMRFLNFVIFTSVLLTTTFFVNAMSESVRTSLFLWYESLVFVCVCVLLIIFFGDLQNLVAKN